MASNTRRECRCDQVLLNSTDSGHSPAIKASPATADFTTSQELTPSCQGRATASFTGSGVCYAQHRGGSNPSAVGAVGGAFGFFNYSHAHTDLRALEGIIHVEEWQSRESEQPKRTQRSSWPVVLEWRERSSYLPTVFEIFFWKSRVPRSIKGRTERQEH